MTGSDWSFIGVAVSVVGTLIAAYGSRLSGQEAKSRSDQLVVKSQEVVSRTAEVAKKSEELAAKSDQLAEKSDEIAKLNREIADLSQRYAAYAMGTDSYFYLHVRGFGGPSPRADVRHIGANPVRDTEVLVFDISQQIADLGARRVTKYDLESAPRQRHFVQASYAGRPTILDAQVVEANPSRDTYAYFVNLQGANGTYRQVIQFRKVSDGWKQGYIVERVRTDDTREPIGQFFDEAFPADGDSIVRPAKGFPQLR